MKFILALTIPILLLSCGATTSQNELPKMDVENWDITNHTITTNTYTASGLIDTSFQITDAYEMGMKDTVKSITIRYYKNKKLTDRKEFTLEKDGSKILANETINQYDLNDNLISKTEFLDGNMLTKNINIYNDKRQMIKSILVFKRTYESLNDYNLDSAVGHYKEKKQFHYDTTINTYEYDLNGNQTRMIDSDKKGVLKELSITQYSGNMKTFSFSLSPKGDTTSKIIFQQDGKLTKEISDMVEINADDTLWIENDKIVKDIGHNGKMKHKDITIYNDKGDEIENTSYR
ncbi:MAG: hypothetical protein ABJB05_06470 [Parafilimonas sp.]